VLVEAAVGHHLIDEEQLTAAVAPADELHQVAVQQLADDLHLRGVLFPPLLRALGARFNLKKYLRSPINGFIGFIGKSSGLSIFFGQFFFKKTPEFAQDNA